MDIERVKQIAGRVGIYHIEQFDTVNGSNQLERFAQEIAKECVGVISTAKVSVKWHYVNQIAMIVKEHFGV